jgi:hypothetical protein
LPFDKLRATGGGKRIGVMRAKPAMSAGQQKKAMRRISPTKILALLPSDCKKLFE